jgi:hypothetical protein
MATFAGKLFGFVNIFSSRPAVSNDYKKAATIESAAAKVEDFSWTKGPANTLNEDMSVVWHMNENNNLSARYE